MRSPRTPSFRAIAARRATVLLITGSAVVLGPAAPPPPPALDPQSVTPVALGTPLQTRLATIPAELVGTWSNAEGNAEIAYRFLADGRFRSVRILNQLRPGGLFEFRLVRDGTVEVAGDQLVLHPTQALKSVTDPDEPARSYTDQPASLDTESFTWSVTGSTLVLLGTDGIELTFARQP